MVYFVFCIFCFYYLLRMLYCSNDTLFERLHVDSKTSLSNSILEAHTTVKLAQNLTFLKLIIIIPSKVYGTLFFLE